MGREVGFSDEVEIRDVTLKLFEMFEEMQENPPSGTNPETPKDFEVSCDEFVVEFSKKSDDASLTKLWRCITSSRMRNRCMQENMKRDIMTVLAQLEEIKHHSKEVEAHFRRLEEADLEGIRRGDENALVSIQTRFVVADAVAQLAQQKVKEINAAIEAKMKLKEDTT